MTRLAVTRGRDLGAPLYDRVDVVVVGSGAGGAVAAQKLARAGHKVCVLEEGGYYAPEEYGSWPPTHTLRRMWRESGLGVAVGLGDTPVISVTTGRCVGGSSVLTGGVCFRIPDSVLHTWVERLGLRAMTPEALAPHFEAVEQAVHVEEVPVSMRSRATELLVEGAAKLGIPMKSLRRNTRHCYGASRCNFGCPQGAKQSVDIAYLPDAVADGARIVSDALVESIDHAGGQATGVRGRFIDHETRKPRVPFEIRAKVVIIACGSIHTPVLLRQSGLHGKHVGRGMTLHPAFRVNALFDEAVQGWDGAMQSVYSDHFHKDGLTLVGVYSPPNVLAAAFPGVGKEHRELAERLPRMAIFGGMVHDDGGGSVRRWIGREPVTTYRMVERDKKRLFFGMQTVAKMAFAAGARQVILPIFGTMPFKSASEVEFLTSRPPAGRLAECMAFHPLGSARMGASEGDGVVGPTGEVWAMSNLFVCDGSVLPTSIGVNSQLPVMAVADKIATGICDDWSRLAGRAR